MHFEKGNIYHIYNQGNNRQKIFFNRENYLFFLMKIRKHILPWVDVLAWCLMPNHFHLMVLVNEVEIGVANGSGSATSSRAPTPSPNPTRKNSLNKSIGILLASYTRAIQKQENISGSLFRQKTKAECVNCPKGISPNYYYVDGIVTSSNIPPEKQYPQVCFNYIHQNPVKSGLVARPEEWEFSSAMDYCGKRKGGLINRKIASYYGFI